MTVLGRARPVVRLCVGLLIVCTALGAHAAAAVTTSASVPSAAQTGITITPSQKELVVSSGLVTATTQIQVTNRTGKDLNAVVGLVDLKSLDESRGVSLSKPGVASSKYGLANWMSLPNGNRLALPNGKPVTFTVEVSNRADLSPGGHYGAAIISFGGNDGAGTIGATTFSQELVSLLLVTKLGGEDYGLQLRSLHAAPAFNGTSPTLATTSFNNIGNVHVVPRGYITLTNRQGRVLAKGIINPESRLILPGSSKTVQTSLQSFAPIASGRYMLTAHYRYEGQKDYQTVSVTITHVTPLLIGGTLAIITGVTVLLVLLYRLRTKLKNKLT